MAVGAIAVRDGLRHRCTDLRRTRVLGDFLPSVLCTSYRRKGVLCDSAYGSLTVYFLPAGVYFLPSLCTSYPPEWVASIQTLRERRCVSIRS